MPSESRLREFIDGVIQWNPVCKLVSRRDIKRLRAAHVEDSLGLIEYISSSNEVVDIGPGGGFPSIPLALTLPDTFFLLVERSATKCAFLRHMTMKLKLTNVEVIEQDVRTFIKQDPRKFDTVTARAVTTPAILWQWSKSLLKSPGQLLLQTSQPVLDSLPGAVVTDSVKAKRGFVTAVRLDQV